MSSFFNKSLREVIEESASNAPTPGGGSVSAVVACFGVAMTAMVCNLTLGKEKYKEVEPQVKEILNTTGGLLNRLEELVKADMESFDSFMAAYRLPKGTEEEKAVREAAVQKALKSSTDTPMEIARVCLKALKVTEQLSKIGNKMAISDAGVAALAAEAALNGVLLSADANIPSISDRDYVNRIVDEKKALVMEAGRLKEKTLAVVRQKMG